MPRKPTRTKIKKMKRSSVRKSASGQIAKKRWDATAVIHQNIYSEQGLAE